MTIENLTTVFIANECLISISIIGMNPHDYYIKTRLGYWGYRISIRG